jgi:hypothetical protein
LKIPRPFNRIFNRGEKLSPEMKSAMVIAHLQSEASRGVETNEQILREQLGTNYEMLHDPDVEALLTEEVYQKLYWVDETQKSPESPLGKVHVAKGDINFDMAALRLLYSQVNRSSFISPHEALIIKIKLRNIMRRIKLQTRPDQYSLGFVNFLKAVEINMMFLLNDAIEGRKARLLKTSPRVTTLAVEQGQGISGVGNR